MKFLFYTLFLLAAHLSAANIQTHLSDLNSTDNDRQMQARNAILSDLAKASAPGAPGDHYTAMLKEVYDAVQSGSHDLARAYLVEMVGLFGDENSATILYPLLGDANPVIRDRARKALSALPGPDAPTFLMNGLRLGPAETRAGFVQALVYIDHKPAWESIVRLVDYPDPETQRVAVWALGQLGVTEALEPLWAAREKMQGRNLLELETAILNLNPDSPKATVLARTGVSPAIRVAAFNHLAAVDPTSAISLLNTLLADQNFPDRAGFIDAAMMQENSSIQQALINDKDRLSSDEKIIMIGTLSDQRLSPYESLLVTFLDSDDTALARAAADALGWIGGDESFRALAAYTSRNLSDDLVIAAMGRLNSPAADQYYLSVLANPGDITQARAAITMVSIRNSPGGVSRLNALAIGSDRPELQEAAFTGLEGIGDLQSIQYMLAVILEQGPLTRPAQLSLKRLSLNYGEPDVQWNAAYLPALKSAQAAESKISIIQILDGAAGELSLAYLYENAFDPGIGAAVIRSLQRWPKYDVASVWVRLSEDPRANDALRRTAVAALRRTFNSSAMDGEVQEKARAAAAALALSKQPEIKQSIASGFDPESIERWHRNAVRRILEDFRNDPDVRDLLAPLYN